MATTKQKQHSFPNREAQRDARRLALYYFLFAASWIILSDVAVALWTRTADLLLVLLEIGKGLLFVLVTAFLLYLVTIRILKQLRRQDQLLLRMASAVAGVTSETFFPTLVRQLAETLGADHAFVGSLLPDGRVRTLAAFSQEGSHPPIAGELTHSPCGEVAKGTLCYVRHARQTFPDDALLKELEIDEYIGMPLKDRRGEVVGIIAVLSRQPLAHVSFAEAIFAVFAERAAAELAQRRAEEEVLRRVAQITTVFDALNSHVFVSSLKTDRLLFANRLGLAAAGPDWESLAWYEVLGPRQPPHSICPPLDLEGDPCVWEFYQSSSERWFQCIDRIITWVDGSPVRMEIVLDITEMKRLEEIKEEMVAAVSHEMRTPLTAILGFTEFLLAGGQGEEERRTSLETIYKATERLNELIGNFLQLQRLSARLVKPMQQKIEGKALFIQAAARLAQQYPHHRCRFDCPDELAVSGNPEHLQEVVDHLVSNAAKYSPAGTLVTLEGKQEGESVLLRVSDEGPGIPPELREKIFEPFYRRDNTTRRLTGGAGLGLTLVREIVALHHGEVWVEDGPGGVGSTFVVRLPLHGNVAEGE